MLALPREGCGRFRQRAKAPKEVPQGLAPILTVHVQDPEPAQPAGDGPDVPGAVLPPVLNLGEVARCRLQAIGCSRMLPGALAGRFGATAPVLDGVMAGENPPGPPGVPECCFSDRGAPASHGRPPVDPQGLLEEVGHLVATCLAPRRAGRGCRGAGLLHLRTFEPPCNLTAAIGWPFVGDVERAGAPAPRPAYRGLGAGSMPPPGPRWSTARRSRAARPSAPSAVAPL